MKNKKLSLRCLCEAAIMIALAQLLGYIKLYELPQGGSINLGMLPIFLFCARWGFGPGMLASFAFSLLQLFLDGAYAWVWQSIIGDYILGFTVLGFAGLFHKNRFGFFYGALLGCALRFLCSYITGVVQRFLHAHRLHPCSRRRLAAVEAPRQVHPRRGPSKSIRQHCATAPACQMM